MPLSEIKIGRRLYRLLSPSRLTLADFSGGLQMRARPEGGDPRVLLQARNMDLAHGRCRIRSGHFKVTGTPGGSTRFTYAYYSTQFDKVFFVDTVANKIYSCANLSTIGTFVDVTGVLATKPTAFFTSLSFVDFNGSLVAIANDGLYTYDGTLWTLQTSAITGTMIAAWQNKLWTAGNTTYPYRVTFLEAGSYSSFDVDDYVDVREGRDGDSPITALISTTDMDILGRPSLLVGKRRSLQRINSPVTGEYSTLAEGVGVVGRRAIACAYQAVVFIGEDAIYETDGVTRPVRISEPVSPILEHPSSAGLGKVENSCVGAYQGTFVFSVPGYDLTASALDSYNVAHMQFDIASRTWVNHSYPGHTHGVSCYVTIPTDALASSSQLGWARLYSCDNGNPGSVFLMFRGGNDGAADTDSAIMQTPFMQLTGGTKFRVLRVQITALTPRTNSPLTLRVRFDGATTDSAVRTFTFTTGGQVQEFNAWRLGAGHALSLQLELKAAFGGGTLYAPDGRDSTQPEILKLMVEYLPTGVN